MSWLSRLLHFGQTDANTGETPYQRADADRQPSGGGHTGGDVDPFAPAKPDYYCPYGNKTPHDPNAGVDRRVEELRQGDTDEVPAVRPEEIPAQVKSLFERVKAHREAAELANDVREWMNAGGDR